MFVGQPMMDREETVPSAASGQAASGKQRSAGSDRQLGLAQGLGSTAPANIEHFKIMAQLLTPSSAHQLTQESEIRGGSVLERYDGGNFLGDPGVEALGDHGLGLDTEPGVGKRLHHAQPFD